jgi:hypothetical protein
MTSELITPVALAVAGFLAAGYMLRLALNWIDRQVAEKPVEQPRVRDLSDPAVRADLEAFLAKNAVIGEADIRYGKVYPAVSDDRLDPLAIVLSNAAAFGVRVQHENRNANITPLYIYSPVRGEFRLLGDLDLDHIIDAANAMRNMAASKESQR